MPQLSILFHRKLRKFRHLFANKFIIDSYILDFLSDLVKEGRAFEPGFVGLFVEDGEAVEVLGKHVHVGPPRGIGFSSLLHKIRRQERVLGRDQTLPKAFLVHLLTNRRSHGHLKSNDHLSWNMQDSFTFLDISSGMNTSIILFVVAHF